MYQNHASAPHLGASAIDTSLHLRHLEGGGATPAADPQPVDRTGVLSVLGSASTASGLTIPRQLPFQSSVFYADPLNQTQASLLQHQLNLNPAVHHSLSQSKFLANSQPGNSSMFLNTSAAMAGASSVIPQAQSKSLLTAAMTAAQSTADLFRPTQPQPQGQLQPTTSKEMNALPSSNTTGAPEERASYHLFRLQSRIQHLQEDLDLIQSMRQDEAKRALVQQETLRATEMKYRLAQVEQQQQQQHLLKMQHQRSLLAEQQADISQQASDKLLDQSKSQNQATGDKREASAFQDSTAADERSKPAKPSDEASNRSSSRRHRSMKWETSSESSESSDSNVSNLSSVSDVSRDSIKQRYSSRSRKATNKARQMRSQSSSRIQSDSRSEDQSQSRSRSRSGRGDSAKVSRMERDRLSKRTKQSNRRAEDNDEDSHAFSDSEASGSPHTSHRSNTLGRELRLYYDEGSVKSPTQSNYSQRTPTLRGNEDNLDASSIYQDAFGNYYRAKHEFKTPQSKRNVVRYPNDNLDATPIAPKDFPYLMGTPVSAVNLSNFEAFQEFLASQNQADKQIKQMQQLRSASKGQPQAIQGHIPEDADSLNRPMPIPVSALSAPGTPQNGHPKQRQIQASTARSATPGIIRSSDSKLRRPISSTRRNQADYVAKIIASAVREAVKSTIPSVQVTTPPEFQNQGAVSLPSSTAIAAHVPATTVHTAPVSAIQSRTAITSSAPVPTPTPTLTPAPTVTHDSVPPTQATKTLVDDANDLAYRKRLESDNEVLNAKLQRSRARSRLTRRALASREYDIARLRQAVKNLGVDGNLTSINDEAIMAEGKEASLRSAGIIDLLAGEDSESDEVETNISSMLDISDNESVSSVEMTNQRNSVRHPVSQFENAPRTPVRRSKPAAVVDAPTLSNLSNEQKSKGMTPRKSQSKQPIDQSSMQGETLVNALLDLSNATSWIEHLTTRCNQLKQECAQLKKQRDQAEENSKKAKQDLESGLSDAEKALQDALEQISKKQDWINLHKSQIEEQKSEHAKQIESLNLSLESARKQLKASKQESEEELSALKEELFRVKRKLRGVENESDDSYKQKTGPSRANQLEEVSKATQSIESLQNELFTTMDDLRLSQEALLHRDAEAKEQQHTLNLQLTQLQQEIANSRTEAEDLNQMLSSSESVRLELEKNLIDQSSLLAEEKARCSEHEQSIAALVEATSTFRVELENAQRGIQLLEQKVQLTQKSADSFELEAARYRDIAEMAAVRAEDGSMSEAAAKSAHDTIQKQREDLVLSIAQLQGELTGLRTENEVLKTESQRRGNEVLALRLELDVMRENSNAVENQRQMLIRELSDANQQLQSHDEELNMITAELASKTELLDSEREEFNSFKHTEKMREQKLLKKLKTTENQFGILRRALARALRSAALTRAATSVVTPSDESNIEDLLWNDPEDDDSSSKLEHGSNTLTHRTEFPPDPELEDLIEKRIQEHLLEIYPPSVSTSKSGGVNVGAFDVALARMLGSVEAQVQISKLRESSNQLKRTHSSEIKRLQGEITKQHQAYKSLESLGKTQKSEYEESLAQLEGKLENAHSEITKLKNTQSNQKEVINSLQSQVKSAEKKVADVLDEMAAAEATAKRQMMHINEIAEKRIAESSMRIKEMEHHHSQLIKQIQGEIENREAKFDHIQMEREKEFALEAERIRNECLEYVNKSKRKIEKLESTIKDGTAREHTLLSEISALEEKLKITKERTQKVESELKQFTESRAYRSHSNIPSSQKQQSTVNLGDSSRRRYPLADLSTQNEQSSTSAVAASDVTALIRRNRMAFAAKYSEFVNP